MANDHIEANRTAGPAGPETKATFEELLEIASGIAARIKQPYVDHAELLYDENGLPK